MKIIKQKLQFEESLKQRLEFICEFSQVTPTFITGSIRKIKNTNLTYVFVPIARDSKKFERLYKKRTEVERLNGRIIYLMTIFY